MPYYVLVGGPRGGQRVRTERPHVELRLRGGGHYRVTPERRDGFTVGRVATRANRAPVHSTT